MLTWPLGSSRLQTTQNLSPLNGVWNAPMEGQGGRLPEQRDLGYVLELLCGCPWVLWAQAKHKELPSMEQVQDGQQLPLGLSS